MEEEVTLLRDKIDNRQTITLGGCEIYTYQLNGTEAALLKSGIGKSRRRWAQRCSGAPQAGRDHQYRFRRRSGVRLKVGDIVL